MGNQQDGSVSVRVLTRYEYSSGKVAYRTESSGVVHVPNGPGVKKKILGYAEVPKGAQLPKERESFDEFKGAIDGYAHYVHWKEGTADES